jgi:hypothetical protein
MSEVRCQNDGLSEHHRAEALKAIASMEEKLKVIKQNLQNLQNRDSDSVNFVHSVEDNRETGGA